MRDRRPAKIFTGSFKIEIGTLIGLKIIHKISETKSSFHMK